MSSTSPFPFEIPQEHPSDNGQLRVIDLATLLYSKRDDDERFYVYESGFDPRILGSPNVLVYVDARFTRYLGRTSPLDNEHMTVSKVTGLFRPYFPPRDDDNNGFLVEELELYLVPCRFHDDDAHELCSVMYRKSRQDYDDDYDDDSGVIKRETEHEKLRQYNENFYDNVFCLRFSIDDVDVDIEEHFKADVLTFYENFTTVHSFPCLYTETLDAGKVQQECEKDVNRVKTASTAYGGGKHAGKTVGGSFVHFALAQRDANEMSRYSLEYASAKLEGEGGPFAPLLPPHTPWTQSSSKSSRKSYVASVTIGGDVLGETLAQGVFDVYYVPRMDEDMTDSRVFYVRLVSKPYMHDSEGEMRRRWLSILLRGRTKLGADHLATYGLVGGKVEYSPHGDDVASYTRPLEDTNVLGDIDGFLTAVNIQFGLPELIQLRYSVAQTARFGQHLDHDVERSAMKVALRKTRDEHESNAMLTFARQARAYTPSTRTPPGTPIVARYYNMAILTVNNHEHFGSFGLDRAGMLVSLEYGTTKLGVEPAAKWMPTNVTFTKVISFGVTYSGSDNETTVNTFFGEPRALEGGGGGASPLPSHLDDGDDYALAPAGDDDGYDQEVAKLIAEVANAVTTGAVHVETDEASASATEPKSQQQQQPRRAGGGSGWRRSAGVTAVEKAMGDLRTRVETAVTKLMEERGKPNVRRHKKQDMEKNQAALEKLLVAFGVYETDKKFGAQLVVEDEPSTSSSSSSSTSSKKRAKSPTTSTSSSSSTSNTQGKRQKEPSLADLRVDALSKLKIPASFSLVKFFYLARDDGALGGIYMERTALGQSSSSAVPPPPSYALVTPKAVTVVNRVENMTAETRTPIFLLSTSSDIVERCKTLLSPEGYEKLPVLVACDEYPSVDKLLGAFANQYVWLDATIYTLSMPVSSLGSADETSIRLSGLFTMMRGSGGATEENALYLYPYQNMSVVYMSARKQHSTKDSKHVVSAPSETEEPTKRSFYGRIPLLRYNTSGSFRLTYTSLTVKAGDPFAHDDNVTSFERPEKNTRKSKGSSNKDEGGVVDSTKRMVFLLDVHEVFSKATKPERYREKTMNLAMARLTELEQMKPENGYITPAGLPKSQDNDQINDFFRRYPTDTIYTHSTFIASKSGGNQGYATASDPAISVAIMGALAPSGGLRTFLPSGDDLRTFLPSGNLRTFLPSGGDAEVSMAKAVDDDMEVDGRKGVTGPSESSFAAVLTAIARANIQSAGGGVRRSLSVATATWALLEDGRYKFEKTRTDDDEALFENMVVTRETNANDMYGVYSPFALFKLKSNRVTSSGETKRVKITIPSFLTKSDVMKRGLTNYIKSGGLPCMLHVPAKTDGEQPSQKRVWMTFQELDNTGMYHVRLMHYQRTKPVRFVDDKRFDLRTHRNMPIAVYNHDKENVVVVLPSNLGGGARVLRDVHDLVNLVTRELNGKVPPWMASRGSSSTSPPLPRLLVRIAVTDAHDSTRPPPAAVLAWLCASREIWDKDKLCISSVSTTETLSKPWRLFPKAVKAREEGGDPLEYAFLDSAHSRVRHEEDLVALSLRMDQMTMDYVAWLIEEKRKKERRTGATMLLPLLQPQP